jgi:hypothetical protein
MSAYFNKTTGAICQNTAIIMHKSVYNMCTVRVWMHVCIKCNPKVSSIHLLPQKSFLTRSLKICNSHMHILSVYVFAVPSTSLNAHSLHVTEWTSDKMAVFSDQLCAMNFLFQWKRAEMLCTYLSHMTWPCLILSDSQMWKINFEEPNN